MPESFVYERNKVFNSVAGILALNVNVGFARTDKLFESRMYLSHFFSIISTNWSACAQRVQSGFKVVFT